MSIERPHRSEITLTTAESTALNVASAVAHMKPAMFIRTAVLHAAAALIEVEVSAGRLTKAPTLPRPDSPIEMFILTERGRDKVNEMARRGEAGDDKAMAWVRAVLARCNAERAILEDAARRLADLETPEARQLAELKDMRRRLDAMLESLDGDETAAR